MHLERKNIATKKAIAGIYPFETIGIAEHPCMGSLFLPQRPLYAAGYFYEKQFVIQISIQVTQLEQTMKDCALGKYIHALNVKMTGKRFYRPVNFKEWRLFVFYSLKPDVVFLDETTSALDETTENLLYQTIKERLPEMIILSVGHRSTITAIS